MNFIRRLIAQTHQTSQHKSVDIQQVYTLKPARRVPGEEDTRRPEGDGSGPRSLALPLAIQI